MDCIVYKKGYKYQLTKAYSYQIEITPSEDINTDYIALTKNGGLTVKKGYAWDGPSGPTVDTLNFMRGSLVHDALYQLMRQDFLETKTYRDRVDRLLQDMCKQDKMMAAWAWLIYQGLHYGGGPAADPANQKPVIKAPKACRNNE